MSLKYYIRSLLNGASKIIGPERILKLEALVRFHKEINITNPSTLTDKICYLEYRKKDKLSIVCSDKYDVREYVASKGLESILVPLIGDVYYNFDEINFDELPQKFVIKATFGCKMNLICQNKDELEYDVAKKTVDRWISNGFNREYMEPHYKFIPKRIICEEFLENADTIVDYKIHCLNGKPLFILVCSERNKDLRLNLYDIHWKPIHEIIGKHLNDKEIPRPSLLKEMIDISKKLSSDFDFVRVDLYQIGQKIYFGELTFTPDGGVLSYFSPRFDKKMGEYLKLSNRE